MSETETMNFASACNKMLQGYRVRRRGWRGYWYLDGDQSFVIHLAAGEELRSGNFTSETLWDTLADDWEVVPWKELRTSIRDATNATLARYCSNEPERCLRLGIPYDEIPLRLAQEALLQGKGALTEKELDTVLTGEYAENILDPGDNPPGGI